MECAYYRRMDRLFIPKKFEIQFRKVGENEYTGALLLDGMEMSIGKPKTLDEIASFLMPERRVPPRATEPCARSKKGFSYERGF